MAFTVLKPGPVRSPRPHTSTRPSSLFPPLLSQRVPLSGAVIPFCIVEEYKPFQADNLLPILVSDQQDPCLYLRVELGPSD